VLQHVAGHAQVQRAVREGQRKATGTQEALGRGPARGQLAGVGVDPGVSGAGAAEGVGEVAGPSPDVHHPGAGQWDVSLHLSHGVLGQQRVEPVRVGLLDRNARRSATLRARLPRGGNGAATEVACTELRLPNGYRLVANVALDGLA
jgi:hypothetical protein